MPPLSRDEGFEGRSLAWSAIDTHGLLSPRHATTPSRAPSDRQRSERGAAAHIGSSANASQFTLIQIPAPNPTLRDLHKGLLRIVEAVMDKSILESIVLRVVGEDP